MAARREITYLNGQPAAVRIYGTQDGMYYFLNDHLGTPQKIVNSSAQLVWAAAYLPFGKAQIKPETVTNNLRFPGQYYDAESGLHYNWNRYYDPDTGRYITADPIGLSGGINLYAYVNGNPMSWADPSGLKIRLVGEQSDSTILQGILSNIAGTSVNIDNDGYVSDKFSYSEKFSAVQLWLHAIIRSKETVKIAFGNATLKGGGQFDINKGVVTIDEAFRDCNQKQFSYYGGERRDIVEFLRGGQHLYRKRESVLAHELLGHGLDYIRGDYADNQTAAIYRENVVNDLLGIPSRNEFAENNE